MDITRTSTQLINERQIAAPKKWVFPNKKKLYFILVAPVLFEPSNEGSCVFATLKSIVYTLPQSAVSRRSCSTSEANFSCHHESGYQLHLKQKVKVIWKKKLGPVFILTSIPNGSLATLDLDITCESRGFKHFY